MSFVPPLASVAAVRPVFMIVMGISLMVFVFRLAKSAETWSAFAMTAGAALLGFGYIFVLPRSEALAALHVHPGEAAELFWQFVKMTVMNCGWLLLGTGIALHAGVFRISPHLRAVSSPSPHESAHRRPPQNQPAR